MTSGTGPDCEHKPLRVAFVGLGRYSGGSPIPFHLAVALARDHDVRVFVGAEADNLPDWTSSGLRVDVRPVYRSAIGALWSLLAPYRLRKLAQAIESAGPDVVLVPFFHLWAPLLATMVRRPFVVFVHDPEPHPGLVGRLFHVMERRLIRRASHVIIHSSTFLPVIQSVYGVHSGDVSVVPIGPLSKYQTDAVVPARTQDRDPRGSPTVLFFGRIEEYKGIDVLLDAMPLIRAAVPDAMLRLVGQGGSAALLARARRTPGVAVDNRWIEEAEVPRVFSVADVVVLPYTTATQSGVIPVAATFALPVVATSAGGLPEQLNNGACGLLVDPQDPCSLARAIVEVVTDRERARQLGNALHEEYAVRRSWKTIAAAVTIACHQAVRRYRTRR